MGRNCWWACGRKSGPCKKFCGPKGWCCRKDWVAKGCDGGVGGNRFHTCVFYGLL